MGWHEVWSRGTIGETDLDMKVRNEEMGEKKEIGNEMCSLVAMVTRAYM